MSTNRNARFRSAVKLIDGDGYRIVEGWVDKKSTFGLARDGTFFISLHFLKPIGK